MSFSLRALNRVLSPSLGRCLSSRTGSIIRRASAINSRPRFYATSLEKDPNDLVLKTDESGVQQSKVLPKLWLRQCVNHDTMQRNFKTFEIPEDINVQEVSSGTEGIDILWSDSHKSHYTWTWLNSTLTGLNNKKLTTKLGRRLWNRTIGNNPPEVEYERVMEKLSQEGMAELTNNIREYGLCFVTNSPKTPEATEKLLESIGPIRNTHYGGFYDFVPDLALADTAYTDIALPAHTDTTYFTEPAGLQAFHLLSHTPPPGKTADDILGGKSLLVDGFYAAHRLKKESPNDYHTLRSVKIPWHASGNKDAVIAPDRAYPVIEGSTHQLFRIRWNNDDRGVVPLNPFVSKWYTAARKWDEILRREDNEYWFQLEPGRILIFDNWRILHGRSEFEGTRRICGGYINRDDFISRWKLTNFPREEVIATNMQLR
ncbi:Trimethyllysine dioxygenase [Cladobotryum mycophilum]|uniref:trimethyllysine dioxygenase n=1 Tax=Cladobotryum mycophilum TaxID=491253 RepID=A0ABR0SN05_9HYPO